MRQRRSQPSGWENSPNCAGTTTEATTATLSAYNTLTATGPNSFNASMLATRLGNLAALQGQFEEAATWHETRFEHGHVTTSSPARSLRHSAEWAKQHACAGNLAAANSYHREAFARFEATGSIEGAVFSLACLGLIATSEGEPAAAIELLTTSLVAGRRELGSARCGDGRRRTRRCSRGARRRVDCCTDARRRRRPSRRHRRCPADSCSAGAWIEPSGSPAPNSIMPFMKRSMREGGPTRTAVVAGLLSCESV